MKKEAQVPIGTIRIGKDLNIYEKTLKSWKKQKQKNKDFPNLFEVIKLFRANNSFSELIDKINNKFLKGQLSPEGKLQGARINILPDGKKIDGAYSLFSKQLTIHDESNNSHWDVIYKNPNGKFAYHYTLDKKNKATNNKYKNVEEFEKKYPILEKNVLKSLKDENDFMVLPMFTLLKTYMRIGNEIYYKAHKSKGLTTLKKSDVKIDKSLVNFKYLGKGGIPQNIIKTFPEIYVNRLRDILLKIKEDEFVFKKEDGNLLDENDFKKAFKRYIGEEFYPHIVRSYFATKQTEDFLKKHKNPKKQEVKSFLISVAEELGHKRFCKKTDCWEDSYSVTISHYIKPKLAEKLRGFF